MNNEQRKDRLLVKAIQNGREAPPPLSDARLEFERRRLMARISSEHVHQIERSWQPVLMGGLVGMAAVALVSVGLFLFTSGRDELPREEIVLAGQWHLESNDVIAQGAQIVVPFGGKAALILEDGTTVWATPRSRLAVMKKDGSKIKLLSGRLLARVQPRAPGHQFEIVANESTVRVLGTVFTVANHSNQVDVRLHEGRVNLIQRGKTLAMKPGSKVSVSRAGTLSLDDITPEEVASDLAIGGYSHDQLQVLSSLDKELDESSLSMSTDKGLDTVTAHPKADSRKSTNRGRSKIEMVKRLWGSKRYEDIIRVTQGDGVDSSLLFYRGKAFGKLGRWPEAADVFNTAAVKVPSRQAEARYLSANAYSQVRAFDKSLDMAVRSIALGGPNADHAWRLKIHALFGQRKYSAAAQAATEYLMLYPQGAHVAEAHFARGTGMRLSKRWQDAANSYGRFLQNGSGSNRMRDDANFYYGFCTFKAGKMEAGKRAIQSYLTSFPGGQHVEQARAMLSN